MLLLNLWWQDAKKHLTQRIQNLDDKMLKQNELARSIKDDVRLLTLTDLMLAPVPT